MWSWLVQQTTSGRPTSRLTKSVNAASARLRSWLEVGSVKRKLTKSAKPNRTELNQTSTQLASGYIILNSLASHLLACHLSSSFFLLPSRQLAFTLSFHFISLSFCCQHRCIACFGCFKLGLLALDENGLIAVVENKKWSSSSSSLKSLPAFFSSPLFVVYITMLRTNTTTSWPPSIYY